MDYLNNKDQHIEWVDAFKGILIVLMVIGHSNVPFVTFIYLFHMASFMIISGYTYSGRKYPVITYIVRKFFSLIVPYYAINIIFVMLYILLQELGLGAYIQTGENIGLSERLSGLFSLRPVSTEIGGASWFLLVLFIAECICRIISEICYMIPLLRGKDIVLTGIIGISGYYFAINQYYLPFDADLGCAACLFFSLGYFIRRYSVLSHIPEATATVISLAVFLFFGGAYFKGVLPANWPTRSFPRLDLFIICSLSGFYLMYRISQYILNDLQGGNIWKYIGKKTFPILMYHFVGFRICTLILIALGLQPTEALQSSPPASFSSFAWIIYTFFATGFCLLISYIGSRWRITDYIINANFRKKEGHK